MFTIGARENPRGLALKGPVTCKVLGIPLLLKMATMTGVTPKMLLSTRVATPLFGFQVGLPRTRTFVLKIKL